jgi:hypothetical protein
VRAVGQRQPRQLALELTVRAAVLAAGTGGEQRHDVRRAVEQRQQASLATEPGADGGVLARGVRGLDDDEPLAGRVVARRPQQRLAALLDEAEELEAAVPADPPQDGRVPRVCPRQRPVLLRQPQLRALLGFTTRPQLACHLVVLPPTGGGKPAAEGDQPGGGRGKGGLRGLAPASEDVS